MDISVGDTLRIIYMNDEPRYDNRTGVVQSIDDLGQIWGTWGGLALIPGEDKFEIIKKAK